MSARDISCNYLSFIHGLILFVESLQTEYFKVLDLVEFHGRLGPQTLVTGLVGLNESSALLPFFRYFTE